MDTTHLTFQQAAQITWKELLSRTNKTHVHATTYGNIAMLLTYSLLFHQHARSAT